MDTTDSSPSRPEVVAGDPFAFAGDRAVVGHDEVVPHGCYRGVVYLTYEEDGYEWTEPVPCRRCNP